MRKDLTTSLLAVVVFTAALGLAYPLVTTGVAQLAFPRGGDGSQIERGGKVVGSRLIGQDFGGRPGYFQSRPSATEYSGSYTFFGNQGPNSRELATQIRKNVDGYLRRERRYGPIRRPEVPADAAQTSGSGVDPHISPANAAIQARRVATRRGLSRERVTELVDQNTDGRFLGVLGEPGVNVLELNLALDEETR